MTPASTNDHRGAAGAGCHPELGGVGSRGAQAGLEADVFLLGVVAGNLGQVEGEVLDQVTALVVGEVPELAPHGLQVGLLLGARRP